MTVKRRTMLGMVGVGAVVGAPLAAWWSSRRSLVRRADDLREASYLQVCAHPDDDLYFMNPDIVTGLRSGHPVTTVYLMAGEADGRNIADDSPDRDRAPVDFAGYAAARFVGIRRAYAVMRTGDYQAEWVREATTIAGRAVEVARLKDNPEVRLVFCHLRVLGAPAGRPGRWLGTLWNGQAPLVPSLVVSGSPLRDAQEWSRSDLGLVLDELLDDAAPTVLRTLDPDPEHTSYRDGVVAYSDHRDHTAAAYFAIEAVRRYAARTGRPLVLEAYRGYGNRSWPRNLSPPVFAEKKHFLDVYGGELLPCTEPFGCGDLKIGSNAHTRGYGQSMVPRYPGTTSWVRPDARGHLVAAAIMGGSLRVWREESPGSGTWAAQPVPTTGDLLPHVAIATGRDGRLWLATVRRTFDARSDQHLLEVVIAAEEAPGEFGSFRSAGNPADGYADAAVRRFEMGMPVIGVDGTGMIGVFVRNFGRGLSARFLAPGGTWSQWRDLGGSTIQEGMCVSTDPAGLLEVYTSSASRIHGWRQRSAGAMDFTPPSTVANSPAAGPVSCVREPSGRLMLVYREPETGGVLALRQRESGGWPVSPTSIGGDDGVGTIGAAVWAGRSTVLVKRNGAGGCSVSQQPFDRGTSNEWVRTGGAVVHAPTAVTDARGDLVLVAIGADARLWSSKATRGRSPGDAMQWRMAPVATPQREEQP